MLGTKRHWEKVKKRGKERGREGEREWESQREGWFVRVCDRDSPPLPRIPEIAILLMPGVRAREDREGEGKVYVRSRRERV